MSKYKIKCSGSGNVNYLLKSFRRSGSKLAGQEIPLRLWNRMFIAVFTRARF
jgi:hypothetical protein